MAAPRNHLGSAPVLAAYDTNNEEQIRCRDHLLKDYFPTIPRDCFGGCRACKMRVGKNGAEFLEKVCANDKPLI